jgi:outer membrane protein assembly factor BamE (lipoprotein component of BamABCDE complex)
VAKVEIDTWAAAEPVSTTTAASYLVLLKVSQPALFSLRLTAALAVFGLAACAPTVDQRGNLPEPDQWAQIHPGSTTRDQVEKLLGTPSSTGVFDAQSWYYISRKTKQVAFLDPDVMDQQVYVINFDGRGVVSSIDHKGLKDGRDIEPAPGATPAPGRELTFLEQILGNIGRFTKGSGTGTGPSDSGSQQGPKPYDPNH